MGHAYYRMTTYNIVVASYSRLYEEGEVEHINVCLASAMHCHPCMYTITIIIAPFPGHFPRSVKQTRNRNGLGMRLTTIIQSTRASVAHVLP